MITGERVNSVSRSVPASSNSRLKGSVSIHRMENDEDAKEREERLDEFQFNL